MFTCMFWIVWFFIGYSGPFIMIIPRYAYALFLKLESMELNDNCDVPTHLDIDVKVTVHHRHPFPSFTINKTLNEVGQVRNNSHELYIDIDTSLLITFTKSELDNHFPYYFTFEMIGNEEKLSCGACEYVDMAIVENDNNKIVLDHWYKVLCIANGTNSDEGFPTTCSSNVYFNFMFGETTNPSLSPTDNPTTSPTKIPTITTLSPTSTTSIQPTTLPTDITIQPTRQTSIPTVPSISPTQNPTSTLPTQSPTIPDKNEIYEFTKTTQSPISTPISRKKVFKSKNSKSRSNSSVAVIIVVIVVILLILAGGGVILFVIKRQNLNINQLNIQKRTNRNTQRLSMEPDDSDESIEHIKKKKPKKFKKFKNKNYSQVSTEPESPSKGVELIQEPNTNNIFGTIDLNDELMNSEEHGLI